MKVERQETSLWVGEAMEMERWFLNELFGGYTIEQAHPQNDRPGRHVTLPQEIARDRRRPRRGRASQYKFSHSTDRQAQPHTPQHRPESTGQTP